MTNWMRADLSLCGRRIRSVANPQTEQDAVNLRTLPASVASVLQEATSAADMVVGDAITSHANILNREDEQKAWEDEQKSEQKFELGPTRNSSEKF